MKESDNILMSVNNIISTNDINSKDIRDMLNSNVKDVKSTMNFIEELAKAQETEQQKTEVNYDSHFVHKLEDILGVTEDDIKTDFTKDNGKINIMEMLNKYGNDVSSKDLRELQGTVTGLYKEGSIDAKDYFTALKWIAEKMMQKSLKMQMNDLKNIDPESDEDILKRIANN